MKICLVHEEYPEETNFGGIATYQKNCAEEYVKLGNEVIVICRSLQEDKFYIENGVKVYRIFVEDNNDKINFYHEYRKKVCRLLRKLQKDNKIDIIEVPDWGAETVFFEKYRKIPLVVRLHTPLRIWLEYNKNNFGIIKDELLKWEDQMIESADYVTCCSEALKRLIVKKFKINANEIVVTPNPANITNFFYNSKIQKEHKLLFVGSLEERKGVIVLANALNDIFEKYPDLKVQFIGKDTNRNSKNISTIRYIKQIVDSKYLNNLEFVGQIENSYINKYMNEAQVGVFPSLFDNFPYVVLESMATGLQIVGSENSGMKEMLDDDESLYISGNYKDLTNKIIKKIEVAQNTPINFTNIERVNKLYNCTKICTEMLKQYENVIRKFYLNRTSKNELEEVLKNVTKNNRIIKYQREKGGVANYVYRVTTSKRKYIIKKYTNDNDFNLSNKLYDIYSKNDIDVVKPLNKQIIDFRGLKYNVFDYINKETKQNIDVNYFKKLLICNRKYNGNNLIVDRCNYYYNELKNTLDIDKRILKEVKNVCDIYDSIKDNSLLKEKYINHGDISKKNVLFTNNKYYLIDFDETLICSKLYDFAVIVIKFFTYNDRIIKSKYLQLKNEVKKYDKKYSDDQFVLLLRFYLCKILLEKFYLHSINSIDLFSKRQKNDDYQKYYNILSNLNMENII